MTESPDCPEPVHRQQRKPRAAIRAPRRRPGPSDRNKTRTEKICVRLSPDEYNALKTVAKHRGVTPPALCRLLAAKEHREVLHAQGWRPLEESATPAE